ncbi:uncharacterized protein LOC119735791 [Patiria miniata]|uniref:Polyadenylate-binding protein n=1 Tax=Patiria miniata TaxID=46514 RepID=A0A914APV0_PATMI|nr:uncharacterized protein LOC119735791 [Patiria miniata]
MAKVTTEDVLDKISQGHLECTICIQRFNRPKILDCFHSFCLECLEDYKLTQYPSSPKLPCPICRKETVLPDNRIAGLSNNFAMIALVEEFTHQRNLLKRQKSRIVCEVCEVDEAISRCIDCAEYLCCECQRAHQRAVKTKKHEIATLEDLQSGKATFKSKMRNEVPKYKKHSNQEVLICADCTTVDHCKPSHTYEDIEAAEMSFRNEARYCTPKIPHTQRGMYAAGQVAHVCNPCWPQPQARPLTPLFQNTCMPAGGRRRFAQNLRTPAPGATPTHLVHPRVLQQPAPYAQHVTTISGKEPITPSMLAAATPQQQKQMFRERLLPLIKRSHGQLAGKITGMLLEIDNSELLHMLESYELLKAKVDEAVNALKAHQAKKGPTLSNAQRITTFSGQEPLTPSMLAAATPQQQKQMLGERLLPLIQRSYGQLAGRITGMLLEIDNSELLHMLVSYELLKAKVDEAVNALKAHQAKKGPTLSNAQRITTFSGQEPLTPSMLAAATPQQQKQMLGERLHPLIKRSHGQLAGKITGMLLEIDNSELLHMLESYELLKAKVEEAVNVLKAHQAKDGPTLSNAQRITTFSGQEPLTSSMLAAATPQQQKQMLGERLHPLIKRSHGQLAGKITGMLLEIDNSKLLHMLESYELLKAKVEEAVNVLKAHQAKDGPTLSNAQRITTFSGQEPLTSSMLAAATPQQQKQMLGERLHPLIKCSHGQLAGKITGMLLEIDNSELLHMLESYELLKAKVEEAVNVLKAHQAKDGPTLSNAQRITTFSGQEPLTSSMLAAATPQQQKQMLGERLHPLIQRGHGKLAGKITGMLLEIDNSELLHMLESHELLKAKVEEAVYVLKAHQAKEGPAKQTIAQQK